MTSEVMFGGRPHDEVVALSVHGCLRRAPRGLARARPRLTGPRSSTRAMRAIRRSGTSRLSPGPPPGARGFERCTAGARPGASAPARPGAVGNGPRELGPARTLPRELRTRGEIGGVGDDVSPAVVACPSPIHLCHGRRCAIGSPTMPFDEGLAERVRDLVRAEPSMSERKMFGGLCFMSSGHMSFGILGDEIMVRVGPHAYVEALQLPHAREMDFTGRSMRGMVYVDSEGISEDEALEAWLLRGLAYARSLPPKSVRSQSI